MLDSKLFESQQQINPQQRLATGATLPWVRDDAKWFRTHKRYRARQAFPGEMGGHHYDPRMNCIAVRKISRSARARACFRHDGNFVGEYAAEMAELVRELIARGECSEDAARLIFDLATKHAGRFLALPELAELIQLYETGDGAVN
jgi:hypothetical protein